MYRITNADEMLSLNLRSSTEYSLLPCKKGAWIAVLSERELEFFKLLLKTNSPKKSMIESGITRNVHQRLVHNPDFKELLREAVSEKMNASMITQDYILSCARQMLEGTFQGDSKVVQVLVSTFFKSQSDRSGANKDKVTKIEAAEKTKFELADK